MMNLPHFRLSLCTLLHVFDYHGSSSASVSVPSVDSVFTSVLQFVVTPDLECDAMLGLDWIGLCQAAMIDSLTVFPSLSVESTQYVQPNLSLSMSGFHLI